jgi:hypothetical protein
MTNAYNSYLANNNTSNVTLKDYAHAGRVFADDNFRLLPKQKYLFHVVFNINSAALNDQTLTQKNRNEISLLVKSAALPAFTLKTETLNQYNRKKIIQTTHEYTAIAIKFHDDSANLISRLWRAYYSYYYADPTSAGQPGAYSRNAYKGKPSNTYGLANQSQAQFFNHITIYQLSSHEYLSYKLINPMITNWNHDTLNYSTISGNENTMTVGYEAVQYGSGVISADAPEGFGQEHYDTTPSSLSATAIPKSTSASQVTNAASSTASAETLNNVVKSINTYQNSQPLNNSGSNVVDNVGATSVQGVSGIQGTTFPILNTANQALTVAKSINIL